MIKLNRNNKGAALVEYMALLALIGGVSLGVTLDFGAEAQTAFNDMGNTVASAVLSETVTGNTPLSYEALVEIWTGGPVCFNQNPWTYTGGEWRGYYSSIPSASIQDSVAIWFGDNPQSGTTANGTPIIFTIPDENGDGLIQTSELNTITGVDFITNGSSIGYAMSGNLQVQEFNTIFYLTNEIFSDANFDLEIDEQENITNLLNNPNSLNPATISIGC